MEEAGAGELVHFAEEDGGLSSTFLDHFQHFGVDFFGEVAVQEGVLFEFQQGDSFSRVGGKDLPEEVFELFVALEGRRVELGVLEGLGEAEPFLALEFVLFPEGFFRVVLELEGILVEEKVEEEHAQGPDVDLRTIPVLGEVLGSQEGTASHHVEQPFLALGKLAQGEVVEVDSPFLDPHFFGTQVPED